MSEQPRRRRRQIETDAMPVVDLPKPEIIQKESFIEESERQIIVEPEAIKKLPNSSPSVSEQTELKKNIFLVACLIAAGVYIVSGTIAYLISTDFNFISLRACLGYMLEMLPVAGVFVFGARNRRTPASICAIVYFMIWVVVCILSRSYSFSVLWAVALIVFAVKQKKNYSVWLAIGTAIFLYYIVGAAASIAVVEFMQSVNFIAHGMVFLFGVLSIPKPKHYMQDSSHKYPLLEQYKKNRKIN